MTAVQVIPVTIIEAGPCTVTQVKTEEIDGYNAVQIGFEEVAERKLTKGQRGHLAKSGAPTLRRLRELRYAECARIERRRCDQGRYFRAGRLCGCDRYFQG